MKPPYTALIIAKYLLMKAKESGNPISNLMLQKLLYYAQGWYLANYKNELFREDIEAWKYGPVVRAVYDEYKKFGAGKIDIPIDKDDIEQIDEEVRDFLDELWQVYSKYSPGDLVLATHQEKPWKEAIGQSDGNDGTIAINDIRESFERKIKS